MRAVLLNEADLDYIANCIENDKAWWSRDPTNPAAFAEITFLDSLRQRLESDAVNSGQCSGDDKWQASAPFPQTTT